MRNPGYVSDPAAPAHFVSLVDEHWRMTRYENSDWGELYDLENDPEERRNLWAEPSAAAVRADLHERLAAQMLRLGNRPVGPTMRA